jgi:RNA polymerase sigma-70 factor, ECF subfamily
MSAKRPVNRRQPGGVWPTDNGMHGISDSLAGGLVTLDEALEREFETRLVESSTLAFRVAYGVLRNRQDAEDVAQEAFVKAHRNFRQLRDRDRFRAWLVRLTWRLAIDRQRGERRREARDLSNVVQGFSPPLDAQLLADERAARLWQAIDALPEKLRVVVILAGIQEHDLRQVARLLDLPEGTVKSRMFLARQRLKEQLQWMISDTRRR